MSNPGEHSVAEKEAEQTRMPEDGREPASEDEAGGGPVFAAWATGVYLLMWSLLMIYGWSNLVLADPSGWLQYPAWSAARMTNRDLDLVDAVGALPPQQRRLWEWIHGTRDETLANAIAIHLDVVSSLEALAPETSQSLESLDLARAQLAVLLAESGEVEESLAAAEAVVWPPDFAAGLRHAYGDAPPPSDDTLEIFASAGLSEWSYERVAARLAARAGEIDQVRIIEARLLETGRRRLQQSNRVLEINFVIGLLGIAAMLLWAPRARAAGWQGQPTPWSLADGLGVLIRGDFWNRLYYLVLPQLQELSPSFAESAPGELLTTWGTLFASLPLVCLAYRHLYLPHRRIANDPFGFDLQRPAAAWGQLAAVAFVALGVDLAGSYALGWTSWGLGAHGHWAEGFDENLVWGLPSRAFLTGLDYVAWAPVMEELAFRGILFFSLRRRLGAVPAALLSAAVFGLMHFYGLPGLLMTFWSGVVWALAFERARSLLPGIAAHSVYNLLYVLGLVLVYR
jgi:membrane protease YdiL (CAAX protease family)